MKTDSCPGGIKKFTEGCIMGKFIVKTTETGIKFDLLGADGAVLLSSEVYSGERACLNGVESVKKSCLGGIEDQTVEGFEALSHPKFEVYVDQGGKFRFRLKKTDISAFFRSSHFGCCQNARRQKRSQKSPKELF